MKTRLVLLALLTVLGPASLAAQDRAAELEAQQRARLEQRRERSAELEWRALLRGGAEYDYGCPGLGYTGRPGYPALQGTARLRPGSQRSFGGAVAPGAIPGYPGYGCPPGWGYPYATDLYGYRWVPNPYDDWREIWGRGWTDDAAIPPYHRFQYRFFPETLPDPTQGGYITPRQGGWTAPAPTAPPPALARACARIRVDAGDATREVLVELPLFGALTPEALRAVLLDRLQRGGGVAVRALDGFVFRFPPFESIRELAVGGC